MNSIPHGPQEAIGKSHDQHVLHHLFAQVMVDSVEPTVNI